MKQKRLNIAAIVAALLIGAPAAFARNGLEHVMGIVSAINETNVTAITSQHC